MRSKLIVTFLFIVIFISACTSRTATPALAALPTVTTTPTITPTPGPQITYLSDLQPDYSNAGYGIMGVGIYPFDDGSIKAGTPLYTHGKSYSRSLFLNAPSVVVYSLDGKYDTFSVELMISDMLHSECGDGALFGIDADGETVYMSKTMFYTDDPIPVEINVKGVKTLRLETFANADFDVYPVDMNCDYTIWGDPYLVTDHPVNFTPQTTQISLLPTLQESTNANGNAAEFYVSPDGSDQNNGTITAPFATIQHARDIVRLVKEQMKGPIIIYLRGGTYFTSESIAFSEEDSGENGYDIVYKAYPNETPVISGGIKVEGTWQRADGKPYWKIQLPEAVSLFRNLYVNGKRATRAQSEAPMVGLGWWKGDWTKQDGIYVDTTKLPVFARPQDLELHWNLDWVDARERVENITDLGNSQSIIKMKQPYFKWATALEAFAFEEKWTPSWKSPFYLENALELLDQPGEWYFNPDSHELFYYPVEGENPQEMEFFAPEAETLVTIKGSDFNHQVHNLQFDGLTFKYSSWLRANYYGTRIICNEPADGFTGEIQPAPAAMELINAKDIQISNNVFSHLGAGGIALSNNIEDVSIIGNALQDVSKDAIILGQLRDWMDDDTLTRVDPPIVKNVVVKDNLINGAGIEYWGSQGIEYFYGTDIDITHNYIRNVANSGVHINGGCSVQSLTADNINVNIDHNKIEDTSEKGEYPDPFGFENTSLGGDAGGIYTSVQKPGLVISDNYIKDVINHYSCIYLDGGTVGVDVTNNVCDNAPSWIYFGVTDGMSTYGASFVKNVSADGNFTNEVAWVNGMNPFVFSEQNPFTKENLNISIINTHNYINANFPADAQVIITNAGLEPEYLNLEGFLTP
jgi:hypothetical protein